MKVALFLAAVMHLFIAPDLAAARDVSVNSLLICPIQAYTPPAWGPAHQYWGFYHNLPSCDDVIGGWEELYYDSEDVSGYWGWPATAKAAHGSAAMRRRLIA